MKKLAKQQERLNTILEILLECEHRLNFYNTVKRTDGQILMHPKILNEDKLNVIRYYQLSKYIKKRYRKSLYNTLKMV